MITIEQTLLVSQSVCNKDELTKLNDYYEVERIAASLFIVYMPLPDFHKRQTKMRLDIGNKLCASVYTVHVR